MLISLVFHLVILRLSTVFCEIVTDVSYTLEDFTQKNKRIGNLVYSATKQHTSFEHSILMNHNTLFEIKKNGDLYTRLDIDRDEVCLKLLCCKEPICHLSLKAYLFQVTPTIFNIQISIIDTNDNKPTFANAQTTVIIAESAELYSTYKLPVASDADSVKYGIDSYSLSDFTNTFVTVMDNHEPSLKLVRLLDREVLSSYNVQLVAYDKGSPQLSSTIDIKVKISDVNDNAPYFVNSPSDFTPLVNVSGTHVIKIKENQSGDVIYHMHAHDLDDGDNAKIFYSISSSQSQPADVVKQKFSLKSPFETAKIQLRQGLDYENQSERLIQLVIIATDNGKPPKSSSISLTIQLLDENDNHPIINETTSKDIHENDQKRQQLKILSVRDKDSISQHKIKCSLSDESREKFELHMYDWNLYGLFNRVSFDFETTKTEIVMIFCIDRGDPEITHSTNFYVNIIDENDNGPVWEKDSYEVNLVENDVSQRILMTITARDADSGFYGAITYNISATQNSNHLNYIKIDQETGTIYSHQPVDRELYGELVYHITASDNRGLTNTAGSTSVTHYNTTKLVIKIVDDNDNTPKFIGKNKYFKLAENSRIDTIVCRLDFYDPDEPPNNILTMTLMEYNSNTHSFQRSIWFDVVDNNTIVVKTSLNREELSNISLIVNVEDHGRPSRTVTEDIVIEILDENDNAPVLWYPKNNSFISANGVIFTTPPETKLIQLEANDPDNGVNGTIDFTIQRTNFSIPNPLKINKKTGEISTNWHNFELPEIGVYFLQISIDDRGSPPLSTRVLFFVNITTTNTAMSAEAYMSNIVILILIIVCSLALIVSLIAAIFWVRFRVSGDSNMTCHEETCEREHLNKDLTTNNYSLMAMENNFRQTAFENGNLNAYDPYSTRQHSHGLYGQAGTLTKESMNTLDSSRLTPCEDCFNSFSTLPTQINRYESPSLARFTSPISSNYKSPFADNTTNHSIKTLLIQQGYPNNNINNDFNTISNSHPPNLMGEPNFSDSGKGGSVEDLNYRLPAVLSTFTPAPYNNTESFIGLSQGQSQYVDLKKDLLCTK